MEFCSKCDIAYDFAGISGCPLCEAKDRTEELEGDVEKLTDQISDLEREE